MGWLIALILVTAVAVLVWKLVVAPVERIVELTREADIVAPAGAVALARFDGDDTACFTNEQSRIVRRDAGPGFAMAGRSLALELGLAKDGWVIVVGTLERPELGRCRSLHLLARGAGAPTAVRLVVSTAAGDHACWHDQALAAPGWVLLTVPFEKLEADGGAVLDPTAIQAVKVEIHADRKLPIRTEEMRDILLAGVWASPS